MGLNCCRNNCNKVTISFPLYVTRYFPSDIVRLGRCKLSAVEGQTNVNLQICISFIVLGLSSAMTLCSQSLTYFSCFQLVTICTLKIMTTDRADDTFGLARKPHWAEVDSHCIGGLMSHSRKGAYINLFSKILHSLGIPPSYVVSALTVALCNFIIDRNLM